MGRGMGCRAATPQHASRACQPHHLRAELRQLRAAHEDAAAFLLACLADVRQELAAEAGRASLAAAGGGPLVASGSAQQPKGQVRPLPPVEPQGNGEGAADGAASTGTSTSGASSGSHSAEQLPLVLADLPLGDRQAALQLLLERLGVEWQEQEGLVLPSTSTSTASACCVASPRPAPAASPRPGGPCSPGAGAAAAAIGRPHSAVARAASGICVRTGSGASSAGSGAPRTASRCTRSELMEMLQSEVSSGRQGL